jgi:hypothetical protein
MLIHASKSVTIKSVETSGRNLKYVDFNFDLFKLSDKYHTEFPLQLFRAFWRRYLRTVGNKWRY